MKFLDHKNPEDMLKLMLADDSVDAPAHAVTYAKNIFRTAYELKPASAFRRVIAMLTADLAPNRPAFGERSAGGSAARQMLFEYDENGIDIRVSGSDNNLNVRGQILGDAVTGTVELTGANFKAECPLDNNAGFAFTSVPAGEYALTIRSGETEIAIEKLSL
jgi:hypothetical protein